MQSGNAVATVSLEDSIVHHRVADKRQPSPGELIACSSINGFTYRMADSDDYGVIADNHCGISCYRCSANYNAVAGKRVSCRAVVDSQVQSGYAVAAVSLEDSVSHHSVADKRHASPEELVASSSINDFAYRVAYSDYYGVVTDNHCGIRGYRRAIDNDAVTGKRVGSGTVIYSQMKRHRRVATSCISANNRMSSIIRAIRVIRIPPSKRVYTFKQS